MQGHATTPAHRHVAPLHISHPYKRPALTYRLVQQVLEHGSAQRQGESLTVQQAQTNDAANVPIGIQPLGRGNGIARGIEAQLARLVEERLISSIPDAETAVNYHSGPTPAQLTSPWKPAWRAGREEGGGGEQSWGNLWLLAHPYLVTILGSSQLVFELPLAAKPRPSCRHYGQISKAEGVATAAILTGRRFSGPRELQSGQWIFRQYRLRLGIPQGELEALDRAAGDRPPLQRK